jgi:heme/copper-type cytochrome/quinol oxidase subunit 4
MTSLLPRSVLAVAGALVALTLLSYWLGTTDAIHNADVVGCSVLFLAYVKARLVMLHFMEVRAAPVPFRAALEVLLSVLCAGFIGFFLLG